MKQINNYIQEKLKINKTVINKNRCTLFPETKKELREIIINEIKENGDECNLNHIDVSNITDMSNLFWNSYLKNFNGDISKWDVSNVENMACMFENSDFNGDISEWDVSNVENMYGMFRDSKFNGDISKWDVSSVEYMVCMFENSEFNNDISNWKINPDCSTEEIFDFSNIKNEFKPKSLQD